MTSPQRRVVIGTPPSPEQRVKFVATPSERTWLWVCACGLHGWPVTSQTAAYLDWEQHRAVCALRPMGED